MAAPNITLLNATYSGVAGVTLPKQGGGTATFPWVEGSQNITQNNTYDVTNLAEVVVNVSGGGGGLTEHTIHLDFTDSTDEDVSVDYDDSWIASLIATSTPPNYGAKIVDAAYLDGVQWYIRETWELVWEGNARANGDTPYNYFWISALSDVYPTMGSVWRITADGVEYRCTTSAYGGNICIGNTKYNGGPDTGSDAPFSFYNAGWGAMVGDTELAGEVDHTLKFERLVT